MTVDASSPQAEKDQSPIQYPCAFPIKIMGLHDAALQTSIVEIAQQHDPSFDSNNIEVRTSSGGKYLSLTITIEAVSRAQLDAIYRALTAHPLVKVVL